MHNTIETISNYGLSTTSQTSAILAIKHESPFTSWNTFDYINALECIMDGELTEVSFNHKQDVKYTFMYFIQMCIILNKSNEPINPTAVFIIARGKSLDFQKLNTVALSLESDHVSSDGKTSHRSGSKSEKALQIYTENVDSENARATIMGLFQSELNMSKGGATTYFHNMKKKYNNM